MAAPLLRGDRSLGVLSVLDRPAETAFSLDEMDCWRCSPARRRWRSIRAALAAPARRWRARARWRWLAGWPRRSTASRAPARGRAAGARGARRVVGELSCFRPPGSRGSVQVLSRLARSVRRAEAPNPDPGGSPPDRELVDEDQVARRRLQHRPGRVGDEELVRRALGHPLEARRGVGRVADRRVLDPPLGADLPRHHRAAVEADPHPEAVAEALRAHPLVEARRAARSSISRAAASARSAWSGCSIGAPKTAMIPSPM